MKKLILILLLIQSQIVSSQTMFVNQDSVNMYFREIINQYRIKNNLGTMSVEYVYRPFTDNWSNYMSIHNYCGHGVGNDSFGSRVNRFGPAIGLYCTENCVGPWDFEKTLPSDLDDPNYNKFYKKTVGGVTYKYQLTKNEISRFLTIEEEIGQGLDINKNIALFIFYNWKNSPSHNDAMLDSTTNKFYVSVHFDGTKITASYLASE
jgi:uncharacterized protein YkwD